MNPDGARKNQFSLTYFALVKITTNPDVDMNKPAELLLNQRRTEHPTDTIKTILLNCNISAVFIQKLYSTLTIPHSLQLLTFVHKFIHHNYLLPTACADYFALLLINMTSNQ